MKNSWEGLDGMISIYLIQPRIRIPGLEVLDLILMWTLDFDFDLASACSLALILISVLKMMFISK